MITSQSLLFSVSESCIIIFPYLLAVLPLMKTCNTSRKAVLIGAAIFTVISLSLGMLDALFNISTRDSDFVLILISVFWYKRYSHFSWGQTFFIVFTAIAVVSYVVWWAVIVDEITIGDTLSPKYLAYPGMAVQWIGSIAALALLWRPAKEKIPIMIQSAAVKNAQTFWRISWIVPAVFAIVTLVARPDYPDTLHVHNVFPALITIMLAFLVIVSAFYIASYRLVEAATENIDLIEQQKAASLEKMYADHLEERMSEARRANHDLRQFLTVLNRSIEDGDLEGFRQYATRVQGELPSTATIRYCENRAVNAVTLYYCDSIRQMGIKPDVVMIIPEDAPFTSVELTALFGNLMEKAVEALAREIANGADPKTLFFRVHATQQGKKPFVITVDNSCSQKTERSPEGMLIPPSTLGPEREPNR